MQVLVFIGSDYGLNDLLLCLHQEITELLLLAAGIEGIVQLRHWLL